MKTTIALVIAAVAILLIVLKNNDQVPDATATQGQKSPATQNSNKTAPALDSATPEEPTSSDRKREISQRAKVASWHPEQPGYLISPYNDETLAAIGVVSGSKMDDSDGNTFIVPPFDQSPVKIYPVGTPVPDKPGYVINPFTGNEVDTRGVPRGALVRDPNDSDTEHRFRTLSAENE